jgi:hypothetical protein
MDVRQRERHRVCACGFGRKSPARGRIGFAGALRQDREGARDPDFPVLLARADEVIE